MKNTIIDNKQLTKPLIAKLPNWRYFFEILAKLGLDRRLIWIAYSALLLFTIAPILSAFLADLIAAIFGATLDEGSAHPCLVGGYDLGPLLYSMLVYGWLMLMSVPVGIFLILALTISLVVARRLDSKRKAQLV